MNPTIKHRGILLIGVILFSLLAMLFATHVSHSDTWINAEALCRDYRANKIAADSKYQDKTVSLRGELDSVAKTLLTGSPHITLNVKGCYSPTITCTLLEDSEQELAALQTGQKVQISGRCSGMVLGVIMIEDCSLEVLP